MRGASKRDGNRFHRLPLSASDAFAKTQLLGVIRDNKLPHIKVHTVLGPDMGSHSVRLIQLLEGVLRHGGRRDLNYKGTSVAKTHQLVQHRLFSDDFLAVFSRSWLLARQP